MADVYEPGCTVTSDVDITSWADTFPDPVFVDMVRHEAPFDPHARALLRELED
jgi:hypothetical protein